MKKVTKDFNYEEYIDFVVPYRGTQNDFVLETRTGKEIYSISISSSKKQNKDIYNISYIIPGSNGQLIEKTDVFTDDIYNIDYPVFIENIYEKDDIVIDCSGRYIGKLKYDRIVSYDNDNSNGFIFSELYDIKNNVFILYSLDDFEILTNNINFRIASDIEAYKYKELTIYENRCREISFQKNLIEKDNNLSCRKTDLFMSELSEKIKNIENSKKNSITLKNAVNKVYNSKYLTKKIQEDKTNDILPGTVFVNPNSGERCIFKSFLNKEQNIIIASIYINNDLFPDFYIDSDITINLEGYVKIYPYMKDEIADILNDNGYTCTIEPDNRITNIHLI
jgi:hypothetical protein